MKKILKVIANILAVAILIIIAIAIIKQYEIYEYTKKLEEVSYEYNNRQKECVIVGTTLKYIYVSRYDDAGAPVVDSKWKVTNSKGDEIGTFSINKDGNGGLVGLENGLYNIEEISVPENYSKINQKYQFVISESDTSYTLVSTNKPPKGFILLVVRDFNGNPVSGITYSLLSSDNAKMKDITTNEKGLAGVNNVRDGIYYIEETNNEDAERYGVEVKNDSGERLDIIYEQEENE